MTNGNAPENVMTAKTDDDNAPATRGDLRALRGDVEKMEVSLRGDVEKMEVSLRGDMEKMDLSMRAEMREVSQRNVKELRDEIHAEMRVLSGRIDHLGGRIHALACVIVGSVTASVIIFMLNMFLT